VPSVEGTELTDFLDLQDFPDNRIGAEENLAGGIDLEVAGTALVKRKRVERVVAEAARSLAIDEEESAVVGEVGAGSQLG